MRKQMIEQTLIRFDVAGYDLRQYDAMITLAMFARQDGRTRDGYVFDEFGGPIALRTSTMRTLYCDDVIEFPDFDDGYVLVSKSKVRHYTTKLDDGLLLISGTQWDISSSGLVRCVDNQRLFEARLRTPELSLCVVGLQLQLSRQFP